MKSEHRRVNVPAESTIRMLSAIRFIAICLMTMFAIALAQPAYAQSTFTYVVTNDGAINGSTTCTNPLVRNFSVSDSFTVGDVNLGFFATHTWRGDIRVTLEAPDGTRVQLVNGETNNTNGDNINVLLDDAAAVTVNSTNITSAHSTAAPPPFENLRSPNNALSAFNGVASAGTWRMEICDLFTGADDGTFRHAELYLSSSTGSSDADLSLTKTLIGAVPSQGGALTWRLTVTNSTSSTATANGIVVQDTFPTGFNFNSASGDGSFSNASGQWNVGTLAPGQSATLDILGTIQTPAGTLVTNTAEIISSSASDPDSTVNNGNTGEDDFASSSFNVAAGRSPGIPPALACPTGTSVFDWDTISGWTPGSIDNTYAFASFGNVRFQLTNDGVYQNNAAFGGQNPTVFDVFGGGLSPAEDSLTVVADQSTQAGEVVLTITLPRTFNGVQFSIFDVDFGINQFADRVQVSGTDGGTVRTPTLSNGVVNFLNGTNEIIGDGASNSDQDLGNLTVTFTDPVDTIEVRYGNHTTAPTNPGQQGIGVHDITVCNPFTTLNVSKVSSIISDPVNGTSNPKAIPGATVEYLISVANTGTEPTDAGTVVIWDDGPADAKMCLISRSGGPVIFGDPGSDSGLTYDYGGAGSVAGDLAVTTDDLEFSNDDGVTFTYVPSADGDGCDTAITDFRVNPAGAFAAGQGITITVRFQVE